MKRLRATAVAIRERDGRVLLVRDKGMKSFSLPGGRVHQGEPSIAAAARELYEETGLNCSKIEWQFPYKGTVQDHRVFRVTPQGEPRLKDGELSEVLWWDGKEKRRIRTHVTDILKKMGWLKQEGY